MGLTRARVLIAGGAGFIGSHLSEAYLKKGWEVLCLDNFQTGRKENLARILSHYKFELLRHDLIDPVRAEVDLIVNCTTPPSPQHYQAQPIQTLKTSFLGSMHLLGLAKRTGARYVLASSSEVYGLSTETALTENSWGIVNPVDIHSSYVEGKRVAESLATDYHRMHNVDSRIARIFPTYGPRMNEQDGNLVLRLIRQALQGEDMVIYGDGSETLTLCFIDDLVRGLISLGEVDDFNGAMNLGSEQTWPATAIAEKILELTISKSKIIFQKGETLSPKGQRPDLSLARQSLGFEAQTALEAGLKKTIQFYKDALFQNPEA